MAKVESEEAMSSRLSIPKWEFVALCALFMALGALGTDITLPILGQIRDQFQLEIANDQQLVIYAYMIGLGIPQLFFGPLSDRIGRRKVIIMCIIGYAAFAFMCVVAMSFKMLLFARFMQGAFASGTRVVAMSIVRDVTKGDEMAKLMSLITALFIFTPMIAPAFGQSISHFLGWHWVFAVLSVIALALLFWAFFRLPETLPNSEPSNVNVSKLAADYMSILKTRHTITYLLASSLAIAGLYGFLSVSHQVFESFNQEDKFGLWFAIMSVFPIMFNLISSRFVKAIGTRRLLIWTLLVHICFLVSNSLFLKLTDDNFYVFLILFSVTFGLFAVFFANFAAIVLAPFGKRTGAAAGLYGCASTILASGFGYLVTSRFDGDVSTVLMGFSMLGLLSFALVLLFTAPDVDDLM